MTSITFWTSADYTTLSKSVGAALKRIDPKPVHKFVSVGQELYVPEPDELVLAMGANAIALLAQASLVPKNRTADSLRGKIYQKDLASGRYMVAHGPETIVDDPGREFDIGWAVQLIARLGRTGSLAPVLGQYRWVQDFSELLDRIEAKFAETGKPVPVSGDIETLHLSPFQRRSKIVAVGFTERAGHADLLYVEDMKDNEHARRVHTQLLWLLNSKKVKLRGANFKFDLNWFLVKWQLPCTNYSMDTVLVGSLLNENRSNSLKNHVKIYLPELGGYDDTITDADLQAMHLVPREKMLDYLGGDVDGTFQVSELMMPEISAQPALTRFYVKVLHPASIGFQRVEREGIPVSLERFGRLEKDLKIESARLHAEGLALLPARLRAKYADNLSLTRPALLKEYFFSPMGLNLKPLIRTGKTNEPSTAKSHLEMFFNVPEAKAICSVLDKMNQANKALSTYVVGFLKHLRTDGKLHPSYFLHKGGSGFGNDDDGGTITGRLSATDPAIQTVPSKTFWATRIRECFLAPEGYEFIDADFSQGELRIAACLADEQNMLAAYRAGIDLHVKTGAGLAGLSLEAMMELKDTDPKQFGLYRSKAKPANFGIIYGISGSGYRAYAWNGYRVSITEQEAEETVQAFFQTYPGLPNWHKAYKAMAHRDGFVTSPLGRIRHLPNIHSNLNHIRAKAERQAVNSPDQSTLSDMMIMAIGELNQSHPEYAPVAMIHDSGVWLVKTDRKEEACKQITDVMANLPLRETFGWDHQIPFPADAKAGQDLGHLTEWKAAS